jgi:cysteine desulfurase
MHVNNETGVIQEIATVGERLRERGVLFHVDAAQSAGKLPIDLSTLPVDLLSVAAHKFYGPKGIGALYVADRPGCQIEPMLYGGGQQRGRRPGTLPVPLILGFGQAASIARERMSGDLKHVTKLHDRLLAGLRQCHGLRVNGHPSAHYPGILNVSVDGVEGESLLLGMEPVCVATGSACNSHNQEPSYVLRALGLSDALAQSAVRFSFGRFTRETDIDAAVVAYVSTVARLRAMAPAA